MGADRTRSPAPLTIAFAGATVDRAAHLRDGADRLREMDSSRAVLVGERQDVAVDAGGDALAVAPTADLAPEDLTFLGLEPSGGSAVFAYDARGLDDRPSPHDDPPPTQFVSLRELMTGLEPADASLAAYAVGMVGWHRVHRHCGRCGHATDVEHAGHRRRCPNCGLVQFPRTDPAVTMLVQSEDRCLLSRRSGAPARRWSALAGFLEPGETPEQAVTREAREETGVEVTRVEYVASQPWPFPAALMIGFWAFVDPSAGGDLAPDREELVDARWFARAELRDALADERIALPPRGTIGNFLISTWLALS
jgi:NAD+ diphosphatase